MEIVKQMTLKVKAIVVLIATGIVVGVVAFKKYLSEGLKGGELEKAEAELQQASDAKLKEEVQKIEQIKEEELVKVEEVKLIEEAKIEQKEQVVKKELSELAKKDKDAFRNQVNKRLGVKEKKIPGRKPKK